MLNILISLISMKADDQALNFIVRPKAYVTVFD